jgi:methyl-accepting chemotaxis protein
LNLFSGLKTKQKVFGAICAPLVLLVILGVVAIFAINSIIATDKEVHQTHLVLHESNEILAVALSMETSMRGYLLAGKEVFLGEYRYGEELSHEKIAALQQTIANQQEQVARLDEARSILQKWQSDIAEPTIALRREIGDAETMNDMALMVGRARGNKYIDRFRAQITRFEAHESENHVERQKEFVAAAREIAHLSEAVQYAVGGVDRAHAALASALQS